MSPKAYRGWRLLLAALASSWAFHKRLVFIPKPQVQHRLQVHVVTFLAVVMWLTVAQNPASAAADILARNADEFRQAIGQAQAPAFCCLLAITRRFLLH